MFRIVPIPLILLVLLVSGCTHQLGVFRLTTPGNAATLVPPGAKDDTVARASVRIGIGSIPRKTICSPSPHGLIVERKWLRQPRVILTRESLNSTSGTELVSWAVELEKQGCIPANYAFRLADSVIDALPLGLAKRRELLQTRNDLKPVNALRVVAPVYKPGASPSTSTNAGEIISITQANPASLQVDLRDSHLTTGYEIDWYDLAAQNSGPGYRIVPRSAEVHMDGNVERPPAPSANRFQFAPDARWYELYMMTKVSANDFDFVVFSARTSGELEDDIALFQRDSTQFLSTADPASYVVLPHGTGINAYARVRVNGVSVDLLRGNTVRNAIVQANADPGTALARLKIRKLHDGKLYPVEWDHGSDQILSLPLEGGEEIDW
jgi:hypothetical protein